VKHITSIEGLKIVIISLKIQQIIFERSNYKLTRIQYHLVMIFYR